METFKIIRFEIKIIYLWDKKKSKMKFYYNKKIFTIVEWHFIVEKYLKWNEQNKQIFWSFLKIKMAEMEFPNRPQ